MAKRILLGDDKFAIVDDADYGWLSQYNWQGANVGYAMRCTLCGCRSNKRIYMHREIMGFPDGEIDHRNGNKLDNRRCNLRICTSSQNKANTKRRRDNTSGYKGVVFHKASGKWMAKMARKYLGLFTNVKAAAFAYDEAAFDAFGEFAVLNFPECSGY